MKSLSTSLPASPVTIGDVRAAIRAEGRVPVNVPQAHKPLAEIILLDSFERTYPEIPSHGEKVRSVVTNSGFVKTQVASLENGTSEHSNKLLSELLFEPGAEPFQERLEAYIELSLSHVLARTNNMLSQLINLPKNQGTVLNQSQGSSRVDTYNLLSRPSLDPAGPPGQLSQLGQNLATLYNIPEGELASRSHEVKQSLINHVDRVADQSDFLQGLQAEHRELVGQLREQGVLYVTSAGNNADESSALLAQGLSVPVDFDDDVTAVGAKIVVGALDTKGTVSKSDDQIAFFSSQYPAVDVNVTGVGVPTVGGLSTGTSFAAPQVTSLAAKLSVAHPEWSVDRLEREVLSTVVATPGNSAVGKLAASEFSV